ncbi:uncharacterized protein [Rutidosis leptorrhynchoides]|uniref:uncharacterized protein n=1 Tax=Rutidosis leptorrhynchoides TaxID=125765 RepID=UPI003A99851D
MYPMDFNQVERDLLKHELDIYYDVVHRDPRYANLKVIVELSRLMFAIEKHLSYRYVYRLLQLALVLPVATATVERCFSTMKLVKSDLCTRMNDEFLNGCLLSAIEREALARVTDEAIMDRFQRMKYRSASAPTATLDAAVTITSPPPGNIHTGNHPQPLFYV